MQENNIKKSVISGMMWKFMERILAQTVSLVVSIIIARLLDPSDYGVVSIVTVFFSFANVIISGGLNTALIQKKDADQEDYNTVFVISLLVALIIYSILFLLAPTIASVYGLPILVSIIRVLGLSLPIYALKAVVCAYISSNMDFKKFFYATLIGTLVSAVVGILMALNGFGAWALVAQQLTNTLIDTLILFCVTNLKLSFRINKSRSNQLIRYGSKIMLSSLLGVTITQINPIFIGLRYTTSDLSFYTKGRSFPETLSASITYSLAAVLFPMLSKYQDEKDKLLEYTRMYMRVASFIVFPVMLGFAGVSENFVQIFLGSKWLPSVYFIKVICFSMMFDVIAAGNCETIKAMGRSDIFLKIEIIKKSAYLIILGIFLILSNSPKSLAISLLACTCVQILVNSIPNRSLINYKGIYQLMDILPNLISSTIMYVIVSFLGFNNSNSFFILVVQIIVGMFSYIILAIIMKNSSLKFLLNMIKNR